MLETVMRWQSKKSIFEEECSGYPGFVTKFRVSNQFSEASDHVGYENYRHVCHKWHCKMAKAIIICLESKDYVQIRNSLIILIKILPYFPVLSKLSGILEKRIEKVREEEKGQRQDLFILATSYIGQLKARSSQMMRESEFHSVSDKPPKKVEDKELQASTDENNDHSNSKVSNGETKGKVQTTSNNIKNIMYQILGDKDKSDKGDKIKEVVIVKEKHEKRTIQRKSSPLPNVAIVSDKLEDIRYTNETFY